jgi:hypothetical protein
MSAVGGEAGIGMTAGEIIDRGRAIIEMRISRRSSATLLRNWAGTNYSAHLTGRMVRVEGPLINVCQADTQFDVVI